MASAERSAMLDQLTQGAKYHRVEPLLDRLRDRGIFLTVDLAKRMRRFSRTWTTSLRYETGRMDTGETIGLLRTARATYGWVEGQIT